VRLARVVCWKCLAFKETRHHRRQRELDKNTNHEIARSGLSTCSEVKQIQGRASRQIFHVSRTDYYARVTPALVRSTTEAR